MSDPDLTQAETKALRSLSKEPLTKSVLLRGGLDDNAFAKLVAAQWIVEVPLAKGTKVVRFAITDAGRQTIERLPAAKPIKAARASPARVSPDGTTDGEVLRQIIALRAELQELRAEHRADNAELRAVIAALVASSKVTPELKEASAVPFDPVAFRKALRTTIPEIDRRDHHDGLVPIGKVRRALAYLGLDRPTFNAALLEEERAYVVDLKVANNPARAKEPDSGIPVDGRGLLYFVVLR